MDSFLEKVGGLRRLAPARRRVSRRRARVARPPAAPAQAPLPPLLLLALCSSSLASTLRRRRSPATPTPVSARASRPSAAVGRRPLLKPAPPPDRLSARPPLASAARPPADCTFNDQTLQLFTSSLFLAGMVMAPVASVLVRRAHGVRKAPPRSAPAGRQARPPMLRSRPPPGPVPWTPCLPAQTRKYGRKLTMLVGGLM